MDRGREVWGHGNSQSIPQSDSQYQMRLDLDQRTRNQQRLSGRNRRVSLMWKKRTVHEFNIT